MPVARIDPAPIGAVLAGGQGRRMGGAKTTVGVRGEPLLHYPLTAMRAALDEVVVVAKKDTELPSLGSGVAVWVEPPSPAHPMTGIVHALRGAAGRPVFVAAADLALLDPATVRRIVTTDPGTGLAVVPRAGGRLQPLCALYLPGALSRLASFDPARSVTALVESLDPVILDEADPDPFFNVNTPDELLQATAMLDRREKASSTPSQT